MYKLFLVLALLIPQVSTAKQHQSLLLIDATTKGVIASEDPGVIRSIASITKIMTALVALDHYSLDTELVLSNKIFSKLFHKTATVDQLIQTLLVKSDNNAAETLAEHYPGGRSAFIRAMNFKAQQLHLDNTTFADPTGLGVWNRSTAYEVAAMMNYATNDPKLNSFIGLRQVSVVHKRNNKLKTNTITNTNYVLMQQYGSIIGSKTGFTNSAGWCVTMMVEEKGQRFIVVVLGARGARDRNKQAESLVKKIPTVVQTQRKIDYPSNTGALSRAPTPSQYR